MQNNFTDLMRLHREAMEYNDKLYLAMIESINIGYQKIYEENFGYKFIQTCSRDFAGELIRNYFDTSDYNITIDQLVMRMINFSYEDEIDPLSDEQNKKNILNNSSSSKTEQNEVKHIIETMDIESNKLFEKESVISDSGKECRQYKDNKIIESGKESYRRENGIQDEYGTAVDTNVDHTQPLASIKIYPNYIKKENIEELKKIYNSSDNFANLGATANQCKGDFKVFQNKGTGEIVYNSVPKKDSGEYIDITSRATAEDATEATIRKLEGEKGRKEETNKKLIEDGILGEDGKVLPHIKTKIYNNLKASQNAESIVKLQNANYHNISKDAFGLAKNSVGKILQGQIIYYTLPPIIYEVKTMLQKDVGLDNIIEKLKKAGGRICKYVYSKLKDIFSNVLASSLKKFIKAFFDIIIEMTKSTIKKLLKMAKQLVCTSVDAIRVLMSKDKSSAEKMDAILKLFAGTVTMIVLELLFEYVEKQLGIPQLFLVPLQTVITIICMNLSMSCLEELDLFDVKFGFKLEQVKKLYENERSSYELQFTEYFEKNKSNADGILAGLNQEIEDIKINIDEKDIFKISAYKDLSRISEIFNLNIDFKSDWLKFLGLKTIDYKGGL